MTTGTHRALRKKLGEILIEAGLLDEPRLQAALAEQKKWGGRLGRTLIEMGFIKEPAMVAALSQQLGIPSVDLDTAKIPAEVTQLLRLDWAERYGVFPLGGNAQHKVLQVATADPTNSEALQELSFATGMKIQEAVASASSIERAIRRYYYGENTQSSPTATPQRFGLHEETFDPALLSNDQAAPAAKGPAPSEGAVTDVANQIKRLEDLVANQVHALRGIVELLEEKGLFSHQELVTKLRRK